MTSRQNIEHLVTRWNDWFKHGLVMFGLEYQAEELRADTRQEYVCRIMAHNERKEKWVLAQASWLSRVENATDKANDRLLEMLIENGITNMLRELYYIGANPGLRHIMDGSYVDFADGLRAKISQNMQNIFDNAVDPGIAVKTATDMVMTLFNPAKR